MDSDIINTTINPRPNNPFNVGAMENNLPLILETIEACKINNDNNNYNINSRNMVGQTPLYISVMQNNVDMVRVIRKRCLVDSVVKDSGDTSLGLATRNKYNALNILVNKGAKINRQIGDTGDTVLHRATYKNYPELLDLFLNNGGDVNVKTNVGIRPCI